METPLLLSVVIPTYSEPERLLAALQSLALQDYPSQALEVLVVDDASPAFDPAPLQSTAWPFSLRVLRHAANQGRARTRNTGIRAAQGEIVLFLDSDMTVEPGFLRAHALAHRHPGVVAIGHIRLGSQIPANCLTRYLDSRGVHQLGEGVPVPFKCFVTGNSSVRRAQLLKVGLFDEDFRAYGGEDLELGYRLHLDGATFLFADQARSLHHHLRPFPQHCELMHTYGHHSIPVLLGKHPALRPVLRLDFLSGPFYSIRRLFLQLALLPLFYHPIRWAVQTSLRWYVPALCFDYLWWYNRTRGYLQSLKQPAGQPVQRRS
jgi:GT2 family glycosyltransferase